jgi:hypothetical protein
MIEMAYNGIGTRQQPIFASMVLTSLMQYPFLDDLAIHRSIPDERFDEERFVTIGVDAFGRVWWLSTHCGTKRSDLSPLAKRLARTTAVRGGIVMEAEYDLARGNEELSTPHQQAKLGSRFG